MRREGLRKGNVNVHSSWTYFGLVGKAKKQKKKIPWLPAFQNYHFRHPDHPVLSPKLYARQRLVVARRKKKNQVAAIEGSRVMQKKLPLISLSEQQLVDCDDDDNGCYGGTPESAFYSLMRTHTGLESEKDYPYLSHSGPCTLKKSKEIGFVHTYHGVKNDDHAIMRAILEYGPYVFLRFVKLFFDTKNIKFDTNCFVFPS